MAQSEKAAVVAEIKEQFEKSSAAIITEYRGLSVPAMTELRRALGKNATYSVAKNTLVKRAANEAGVEGLEDLLAGPTAIAFIDGEPVDAAKAFRDFGKDHKELVIKGGYMDGEMLSVDQVEKLADLESREVLLAKLAGAMKGNLARLLVSSMLPHRRWLASQPHCRRRSPQSSSSIRCCKRIPPGAARALTPINVRVHHQGHKERKPLWLSSPLKSSSMLSKK